MRVQYLRDVHEANRFLKVAIFGGGGGVGSSIAYSLVAGARVDEIVLIDDLQNIVASHVMDLQDASALGYAQTIRSGVADDALDANVVVISAGVPLRCSDSRSTYLDSNAAIVKSIVRPLAGAGWDGVIVLMTNPVDALLTWIHQEAGFDRRGRPTL